MRTQLKEQFLKGGRAILAELPTGIGKSYLAIQKVSSYHGLDSILIVVPRLVLIQNWKDEFIKWDKKELLKNVTFVTYASLHKLSLNDYKAIIFDECHHLSERCRNILIEQNIIYNDKKLYLFLSATVNKEVRDFLTSQFIGIKIIKITAKEAINVNILPDPTVYLIPLKLNNTTNSEVIIKNPKGKYVVQIPFKDRFKFKRKDTRVVISCTEQQYYDDLSSLIKWYKNRNANAIMKNLWLHKAGERLKWLSEKKTVLVESILEYLNNQRTLTFCNGILQTEKLGSYCINSKNKKSKEYLELFNEEKLHHITACNMLDEGVNLNNCRIGVYAVLNSSDRMILQKMGRILRHPKPIIIIPYYTNTREEEIVNKMYENYNPQLVKVIKNIKDIEL